MTTTQQQQHEVVVPITVRVPIPQYDWLKEYCRRENVSQSLAVARAIAALHAQETPR